MEPLNNGHIGDECFVHCSEVVPSLEVEMYGQYNRQGVNSLSIVGRLSTLQSVHYQRFQCIPINANLTFSISVLQFMSNREIHRIRAPALFLSGLSDQLIPSRMMMELYQVTVM